MKTIFEDLLNQTEIAERIGRSIITIRRMAMDRKFPPVALKIGLNKFYDSGAVDIYLENRARKRK